MTTTTIRYLSHAIPETVLAQEVLEERFGAKAVASIAKMTGIRNRRVVGPGQCASDLAYAAAQRLLAHAALGPDDIGLLVFASQTPDYRTPATAAVLHGRLGLGERCCAFDINQACSSFLHALAVGHSMVVAGTVERALVLNADAISRLINPLDRGLVPLHGDGASAALLEAGDPQKGGFEFFEFGTDGTKFDRLLVPAGGARLPSTSETALEVADDSGCVRSRDQLFMDGPAIFHFCMYKITDFLKELLSRRGLSAADFDLVLIHQANRTMVDLIYKSLKVPPEKRFYYLEDVGNSSGASLPCLLSEAWRSGVVRPGSRTLLCSFGGGLSWGAASIRWPTEASVAVPGAIEVPATSLQAPL